MKQLGGLTEQQFADGFYPAETTHRTLLQIIDGHVRVAHQVDLQDALNHLTRAQIAEMLLDHDLRAAVAIGLSLPNAPRNPNRRRRRFKNIQAGIQAPHRTASKARLARVQLGRRVVSYYLTQPRKPAKLFDLMDRCQYVIDNTALDGEFKDAGMQYAGIWLEVIEAPFLPSPP